MRKTEYRYNSLLKALFIYAWGFFLINITVAQPLQHSCIIPEPFKVTNSSSKFTIKPSTVLLLPNGTDTKRAQFYKALVNTIVGFNIKIKTNSVSNFIALNIDSTVAKQSEGYVLIINKKQISITGHDDAGLFYGLQSLMQLAQQVKIDKKPLVLPGYYIEDHPRFAYRGMMLDVSRHMFPANAIKKWIGILAAYKINTFHWHLTDDQGWRIEIKKYPQLQTISAYRAETLIGHKKEEPHRFDGKRYGGYYTQEEVKDIVQFATQRHITIIPEIEMPGHALSALAAYPNLGCTGGPYQTATYWGVFDDVYCAGNENTFKFLENVLDEVITLFPSKYIHIGGDECPKTRWQTCPKCQQRIKDEHLKDEHGLQSYFVSRIEKYLNAKNRQIIGWDEILEGGLAPGATVMSWTGEQGGISAAQQHHNAIMSPEKYVYLDYYQSLHPEEPVAAGGYTPLNKVYAYEPIPRELNTEDSKYIKGVQANAWSEYFTSEKQAEYMIFPRILALAEVGWSAKEARNYPGFLARLRLQQAALKQAGINAANNFDEVTGSVSTDTIGKAILTLHTTLPGGIIKYTTDGSVPNATSAVYAGPVNITATCNVNAMTFKNGKPFGRVYKKHIWSHLAVGRKVALANQPLGNYNPGGNFVMVNGVEGSNRYNDGEWFGFSGNDLDAVIDLGTVQNITQIGTNILKYHWQKMWEPNVITLSVSADGVQYQEVYRRDSFPVNGINPVKVKINPVAARYIKIKAINKGVILKGEYGAGGKAWLLADEFLIN